MPIYEYVCDDCGAEYERLVMKQGTAITCPKCESAKNTMKLSVFSAHGNGASKVNGGSSPSSSGSGPMPGAGGGCCGGGCGCN